MSLNTKKEDQQREVIKLTRGGFLVDTVEGAIQFGVPPETIKDTMVMPIGVPQIFVLPKAFFHLEKGISVAEIEFPLYFNFFLKKAKTKIICDQNRIIDMENGLQQALFGPEKFDLKPEFADEVMHTIPDLAKETSFFRHGLQLETLVEFVPIKNSYIELGRVEIVIDDEGNYNLYEDKVQTAKIPGVVEFHLKYDVGEMTHKQFIPPRMGMTCLGPSHGFDPKQNTSGFILWLNNRGIMIDPPVASTEWLQKSNVNPRYIDSIILTHCHADHDAGTFQKILAEEKITIYTTHTVMNSFLMKYSALTQIPKRQLLEMFKFYPVTIGKPFLIHQGSFEFYYALHSIPTIGFTVNFRGKTIVYSSDHFNDPEAIEKLHEDGILSDGRKDFLLSFPWNCDLIYHEAGIPPIHTPISRLNELPTNVQDKIVVYHIAEKDFPKETNLHLAKFGIEQTVIVDIPTYPFDLACDILHILEKVEYFNSFNLPKLSELLSILQKDYFKEGDVIIKKGTLGDKFYIIVSGRVKMEGIDTKEIKSYGDYETFGEASLLLNQPRYATVIAETDVEAVTIAKDAFLHLLNGTKLEKKLIQLSHRRDAGTWSTLTRSKYFKNTTSFQKTAFEAILTPYSAKKDEVLIRKDEKFKFMYLIKSGTISKLHISGQVETLICGDLVGDITHLQKESKARITYQAAEDSELYQIKREDMLEYIETYPNIYMNLLYKENGNSE